MSLLRSLAAPPSRDDADLLARVRKGDERAYGELWRRHSKAGLRVAQSFRGSGDADDLVSESFTSIYSALRNGSGPAGAFRPYLYATIRNLAQHTAAVNEQVVSHEVDLDSLPAKDVGDDLPEDAAHIFSAFRSLPARWQSVIWYVEVEQLRMAEVGALLGIKPNAVSALVFRAKSALRVAWLQSQVESGGLVGEHRDVVVLLGGYAQNSLRSREATRVSSHLMECAECTEIADEVDGLARRIAVIVLPLVLGGAAAAAFSQAIAGGAAATAVTAASATTTATTSSVAAASVGLTSASAVAGSISGLMIVALVGAGAVITVGTVLALTVFAQPSVAPQVTDPAPISSPVFPLPSQSATSTPVPAEQSPAPVVPVPAPSASAANPGAVKPGTTTPPVTQPVSPSDPSWVPNPVPLVRPVGNKPTIDGGSPSRVSNSGVITVSGTGSGGAVIVVFEGATELSTALVSDLGAWRFTSARLSDGRHSLSFVERRSGFTDSAAATISVTVDSTAPLSPSFLTTALAADITAATFYGVAEPDAVIILRDASGAELKSVTADADGEWMSGVVSGLTPDSLSFSATQTDEAGNQSAEAPLVLAPYVPTFAAPLDGAVLPPSQVGIHLLGWPGEQVRVAIVGGGSGTFVFDSSGSLSLTITMGGGNLAPGRYTVSAMYVDSPATATVTFSVQ